MGQRQITAKVLMMMRVVFAGLSISMIVIVIQTSLKQNMFEVSLAQPWFGTTLIDFYFNIIILTSWMCIKEKSLVVKISWALAFITLGSIATCFYVFLKLMRINPSDSWGKVLLNAEDQV